MVTRAQYRITAFLLPVVSSSIVSLSLAPSSAAPAQAAVEDVVRETHSSEHIALTSVYSPASREGLAPGDVSVWDLGVAFTPPSQAEARLGLRSTGAFPLAVTVHSCSREWDPLPAEGAARPEDCPGEAVEVVADMVVEPSSEVMWIEELSTTAAPWLRLDVSLPASSQVPPSSTADLQVHVQAWGEEVSTAPGASEEGAETAAPDQPAPTATAPGRSEATGSSSGASRQATEAAPSPGGGETPALARTGVSVLALVIAALGSMLVGRWMLSRSQTAEEPTGADPMDRALHRSRREVRDDA